MAIKKDAVIRFVCPSKLKNDFVAYADRRGRSLSSLLRDYMFCLSTGEREESKPDLLVALDNKTQDLFSLMANDQGMDADVFIAMLVRSACVAWDEAGRGRRHFGVGCNSDNEGAEEMQFTGFPSKSQLFFGY